MTKDGESEPQTVTGHRRTCLLEQSHSRFPRKPTLSFQLARMRSTQTMFKYVRLAGLRGLIAPPLLRSTPGRREGSAGHTRLLRSHLSF